MSRNILEEIAEKRRAAIDKKKNEFSLTELQRETFRQMERNGSARPDFRESLAGPELSFICEVKKASPSKGLIAPDFPYLQIAEEYEAAGANAISVLTEPDYFMGRDEYLRQIAEKVSVPVLRKDFTVDEYQIYEARLLGASAVLLICSLLDDCRLKAFGRLTEQLGMSALVEAHDEEEVKRALDSGAKIIGVNNRNLKNFQVDMENSLRLRELVPEEIVFVSESGIRTREDTAKLAEHKVNAVLIGEMLMRSPDKMAVLHQLRAYNMQK